MYKLSVLVIITVLNITKLNELKIQIDNNYIFLKYIIMSNNILLLLLQPRSRPL